MTCLQHLPKTPLVAIAPTALPLVSSAVEAAYQKRYQTLQKGQEIMLNQWQFGYQTDQLLAVHNFLSETGTAGFNSFWSSIPDYSKQNNKMKDGNLKQLSDLLVSLLPRFFLEKVLLTAVKGTKNNQNQRSLAYYTLSRLLPEDEFLNLLPDLVAKERSLFVKRNLFSILEKASQKAANPQKYLATLLAIQNRCEFLTPYDFYAFFNTVNSPCAGITKVLEQPALNQYHRSFEYSNHLRALDPDFDYADFFEQSYQNQYFIKELNESSFSRYSLWEDLLRRVPERALSVPELSDSLHQFIIRNSKLTTDTTLQETIVRHYGAAPAVEERLAKLLTCFMTRETETMLIDESQDNQNGQWELLSKLIIKHGQPRHLQQIFTHLESYYGSEDKNAPLKKFYWHALAQQLAFQQQDQPAQAELTASIKKYYQQSHAIGQLPAKLWTSPAFTFLKEEVDNIKKTPYKDSDFKGWFGIRAARLAIAQKDPTLLDNLFQKGETSQKVIKTVIDDLPTAEHLTKEEKQQFKDIMVNHLLKNKQTGLYWHLTFPEKINLTTTQKTKLSQHLVELTNQNIGLFGNQEDMLNAVVNLGDTNVCPDLLKMVEQKQRYRQGISEAALAAATYHALRRKQKYPRSIWQQAGI